VFLFSGVVLTSLWHVLFKCVSGNQNVVNIIDYVLWETSASALCHKNCAVVIPDGSLVLILMLYCLV